MPTNPKNGNGLAKYAWIITIFLTILSIVTGAALWGGGVAVTIKEIQKDHDGIANLIDKKFEKMATEQSEWRGEQDKREAARTKGYDKRWERDEKVRDRILLKLDQLTNTP